MAGRFARLRRLRDDETTADAPPSGTPAEATADQPTAALPARTSAGSEAAAEAAAAPAQATAATDATTPADGTAATEVAPGAGEGTAATAVAVVEPEAGPDGEPEPEGPPGFLARGRLRRRLRFVRRAREIALRDLGGLVFDLHRFGRDRGDLVEQKLAGLTALDSEMRALEAALDEHRDVTVLREPGLTSCPRCGAVQASDARFCSSCGLPLDRGAALPAGPTPTGAPAPTDPAASGSRPPTPPAADEPTTPAP